MFRYFLKGCCHTFQNRISEYGTVGEMRGSHGDAWRRLSSAVTPCSVLDTLSRFRWKTLMIRVVAMAAVSARLTVQHPILSQHCYFFNEVARPLHFMAENCTVPRWRGFRIA
jgi:hypothetical protein